MRLRLRHAGQFLSLLKKGGMVVDRSMLYQYGNGMGCITRWGGAVLWRDTYANRGGGAEPPPTMTNSHAIEQHLVLPSSHLVSWSTDAP